MPFTDLFTEQDTGILDWYKTYDPVAEKLLFRQLPPQKVKTVFYGDSITNGFQIQEFFPGCSFMNRGISGDNLAGLYFRLDEDLFPFEPEQVVLMAGINGIQEDNDRMMAKYETIGDAIAARGIKVYFCSILPLRHGDTWDRFQYQGKIVALNARIKELAERKYAGYIDYHTSMLDPAGELAETYARPDGTHITFAGYCIMAEILKNSVELFSKKGIEQ